MSDIAIRVENLGKKYVLRHKQEGKRYKALRDVLTDRFKRLMQPSAQAGAVGSPRLEEFWALKDVSFEIKQGEAVGIIGRNGAGKSTLLKLLSRITEPTRGRMELEGRVASLLEVGTGFHPELTGRENIYLNGAVLGMRREEIKRKFDEIVAFAEVEKFLDTPVKRYSSGMYTRLAFAVAAHLEPEILIVDEVLAVGDAEFQRKCLGKMNDVATTGRTVIFVSHNIPSIRRLCRRGILLSHGEIVCEGAVDEVLEEYLKSNRVQHAQWFAEESFSKSKPVFFRKITICDEAGNPVSEIDSVAGLVLQIQLYCRDFVKDVQIAVRFTNSEGLPVFTTANTDNSRRLSDLDQGCHDFSVRLPGPFLAPGTYSIIVACLQPGGAILDLVEDRIFLSITDLGSHASIFRDGRLGVVIPLLHWVHSHSRV